MRNHDEFVRSLNEYHGDNIWSDVILSYPAYDDGATCKADPGAMNEIIVLSDGTRIGWFGDEGIWRIY